MANDQESKSIYNSHLRDNECSPLEFLAGNPNEGWNAQRNLLKSLNHIELLKRKEEIAQQLLLHSLSTEADLFLKNYELLEEHQQGIIDTDTTIKRIAQTASLSEAQVKGLLVEYVRLGHMELHPSDNCNLRCKGCTYGQDDAELKPKALSFPFSGLERLTVFNPQSILLTGGGEPTFYSSEGNKFGDLVSHLKELLPQTKLALVTNGTHVPRGEWAAQMDWIRVSIDAATPETYESFRGRNLFDKVVENLLHYLEKPVKYVGASFLYSRENIHEYAMFARHLFDRICRDAPHHLPKFNIQYRPLRKNPADRDRTFPAGIINIEIARTVYDIIKMAQDSEDLERFLRNQTNVEAVLGGNTHTPHDFSRCYYSEIFHIIRANADVRPCFVRVTETDFIMGNVINDDPFTIALNTLYLANRKKRYCDSIGCRQSHVNYLLDEGLKGNVRPSVHSDVANDPFF